MHTKVTKWRRWLERIRDEMTFLVWYKEIYLELVQIVSNNPSLNTGNVFWDWTSRNFVNASLLAMRRQIDRDQRAVSLANLLADISDNGHLITRRFFVSLYQDGMEGLGERDFDKIAGVDSSHYPCLLAQRDARALVLLGDRFRNYVNKRLAHADKAEKVRIGTFEELFDGIDELGELFRRYYLLLYASDVRLVPAVTYDWKAIFRQPWTT